MKVLGLMVMGLPLAHFFACRQDSKMDAADTAFKTGSAYYEDDAYQLAVESDVVQKDPLPIICRKQIFLDLLGQLLKNQPFTPSPSYRFRAARVGH